MPKHDRQKVSRTATSFIFWSIYTWFFDRKEDWINFRDITAQNLSLRPIDNTQRHKFDHGHALVVSGERDKSSSTRLVARAALPVGAGVVTLAVPTEVYLEVSVQITTQMMQEAEDENRFPDTVSDRRSNFVVPSPIWDFLDALPGGSVSLHSATTDRATSRFAIAGVGDVLADYFSGVLAYGLGANQAAEISVFLHVECARCFGPRRNSGDIAGQILEVLRHLVG